MIVEAVRKVHPVGVKRAEGVGAAAVGVTRNVLQLSPNHLIYKRLRAKTNHFDGRGSVPCSRAFVPERRASELFAHPR